MWVDASAKTPTSRRRHSRRVCLPDQGRGAHREGCRRHAMAVGALVPPGATRVAIRIATRVATVYTNALKRRGEARSSHLCTLLRSQGHPQPKPTAQQCTQTLQSGAERPDPPICVHYCDPKATHNPSPRLQQCTQTPRNGAERPFPPICVHSCVPTTARVTGRGHWSHDVDGPMAPVMPGRSDLRPTPPRRWRNHPPTRTHEASYRVCIMCHGQLTGDIDRLIWRKENGAERKPDHMKQPVPMEANGFKLPVQRVTLADGNCA